MVALLALALAGCAGPANDDPSDSGQPNGSNGSHPSNTPSTTPGPTTGNPPPGGQLANFTVEGCHGAVPTFDIPTPQAAPFIPEHFESRGFFPGTTQVNLNLLRCERVVLSEIVEEDVALLFSYLSVRASNESWDAESSLPFYTFDVLISNENVADAFRAAGANVDDATFSQEESDLASGYKDLTWTYAAERVTYEIRFHFPTDVDGGIIDYNKHYWFGTNPYERMDISQSYTNHGIADVDVGLTTITGNSQFGEMMGSPVLPTTSGTWSNLKWSVHAEPVIFDA